MINVLLSCRIITFFLLELLLCLHNASFHEPKVVIVKVKLAIVSSSIILKIRLINFSAIIRDRCVTEAGRSSARHHFDLTGQAVTTVRLLNHPLLPTLRLLLCHMTASQPDLRFLQRSGPRTHCRLQILTALSFLYSSQVELEVLVQRLPLMCGMCLLSELYIRFQRVFAHFALR